MEKIQFNKKRITFGLSLIFGVGVFLFCGLEESQKKERADIWLLSLFNNSVGNESRSKESSITIGQKNYKFDANDKEEAKLTLTEYNLPEESRLEFKIELPNQVEVKADIYDVDIERGTRFYKRDIESNEEKKENTIVIKEGRKEYWLSKECEVGGGLEDKGKELRIEIEGCEIEDKETQEKKEFSMELVLRREEEVSTENNMQISENIKSRFFETKGGCRKQATQVSNAIYAFFCHGLYEEETYFVKHSQTGDCYIKHSKYKKCPKRKLDSVYYVKWIELSCLQNNIPIENFIPYPFIYKF